MGHVIKPGKLEISERTNDEIKGLKLPRKVTKLRSLWGLCNVFRRFVPNLEIFSSPLTKKFRVDEPVNFGFLIYLDKN